MVILVWYGGNMVINPEIDFSGAEFIGYIAMFSQLLNPAKSLSTAYYNIQKGAASTERIEMVLSAEEKISELPSAAKINDFNETVEFKNVTFAYEDAVVLKDINLSIQKGKTVALVWTIRRREIYFG